MEIKLIMMKWLEIIELRSVGARIELKESKLNYLIKELSESMKQVSVKIFNHATLESDLSIHLYHNSNHVEKSGSNLGLHLASELKNYAMVNHSIWTEIDTNSKNDF
jgi:hypothetical protein